MRNDVDVNKCRSIVVDFGLWLMVKSRDFLVVPSKV
jgi:hypothetical protein